MSFITLWLGLRQQGTVPASRDFCSLHCKHRGLAGLTWPWPLPKAGSRQSGKEEARALFSMQVLRAAQSPLATQDLARFCTCHS